MSEKVQRVGEERVRYIIEGLYSVGEVVFTQAADALVAERELSDTLAAALEDALANDGWGVRERAHRALDAWRRARRTETPQ